MVPVPAPQDGAHAQQELLQVEGFGQVVVAAGFQAPHAVGRVAARGEKQHRGVVALGAQRAAHPEPVDPRQHDIQHDERAARAREPRERLLAVAGGAGLVTFRAQVLHDARGQVRIVLHHQHARRGRFRAHGRGSATAGHAEHEARALSRPVAVRTDAPLRELHQAPHDEEAEPGAVVGGGAARLQAREFLEQARAIAGRKADAGVAHGELYFARQATGADGDVATAGRRQRGKGVLEHVAHHHIEGQRVTHHLQLRGDAGLECHLRLAGALLQLREHAADGAGELQRFGLEIDPPALEARASRIWVTMSSMRARIREHALDEHLRLLRGWRAQRERLERELQARERGLELMAYQREEAVLLLVHQRLGAQRARDHGDAQPERQQEERPLPHAYWRWRLRSSFASAAPPRARARPSRR